MAKGPDGTTLTPYVKESGISTLGTIIAYGVETTAGTQPTTYTWLERANTIGGVDLTTEKIDSSATDDEVSRYVAGRADTGGDWNVTFNIVPGVLDILEKMISDYKALSDEKRMWFMVYSPYMGGKGIFIVAQPPSAIPFSGADQNALFTGEMSFTIEEYKGYMSAEEMTITPYSKS